MAIINDIEKYWSPITIYKYRGRNWAQWKDEIPSSSLRSGMERETRAIFVSCSELHVEDKDLLFGMFLPDVSVNRRSLLATEAAIGALKSRLVSALVVHMAVLVPLQGEATPAFLALERLHVVGIDLASTYPPGRFPGHFGIKLAICSRSILADHIRPEWRQHVEPWNTETKMLKSMLECAREKKVFFTMATSSDSPHKRRIQIND